MKGNKYLGKLKSLLVGIEPRTYQNSLKFYEPEQFEPIFRREFPDATEDQVENAYVEYIRGYMAVRSLRVFGRTRDEMINGLGKVVEEDPRLRDEYLEIVEEMAKNYDPSKEPTIAETLGIELSQKEVTLEDRIKQMDARFLRLMLPKRND